MRKRNEMVLTSEEMGAFLFELAKRNTEDFIEDPSNVENLPKVDESVLFFELIGLVMAVLQGYRPQHIPTDAYTHMYNYYDKLIRQYANGGQEQIQIVSSHYKELNHTYRKLMEEQVPSQHVEKMANLFVYRLANEIGESFFNEYHSYSVGVLLTNLIRNIPFMLADYEVRSVEENASRSAKGSATRQETKSKQFGWTKRPLAILGSIAGVVLVYLIVNAILVGAQNMGHSDEKAQLEDYKIELKDEKENILSAKEELEAVQAKAESLKEEIDGYEADYPYGIPEELYGDYEMIVEDYNGLVDDYDAMRIDYEGQIDDYNEKVDTANDLAEEVGSTWYIVPVGKK